MSFVAANFRRSFQLLAVIVLSLGLLQGMSSAVWGAIAFKKSIFLVAREAFGVRVALPAFRLRPGHSLNNTKAVRTDRTPNASRSSEILFLKLYTLTPPENMAVYLKLPVIVQSVTGLPFTLFPGLGGADRTKFVADDLINRDELVHTTTYLKGQLFIRIVTSPDTVNELQATINVCEFLLRHFNRIATQVDAQGNRAIGEDDIEQLFAPAPKRGRETSSMA